MKKKTLALAILTIFSVAGCTNTDILVAMCIVHQAKEARSITYGTIVSVRPVKIQADNQGVIGTLGGGALGWYCG